jgi:hypothetical protein
VMRVFVSPCLLVDDVCLVFVGALLLASFSIFSLDLSSDTPLDLHSIYLFGIFWVWLL